LVVLSLEIIGKGWKFLNGPRSWGSKLGFKVGVQSWGSKLGFKKASCSIKNRRHPVFGENVVGNAY
jgi:hypothetical protein